MAQGIDITKFAKKLEPRRRAGKCCCWDCLRADGLTPPLGLRSEHQGLYPHRLYDSDHGGEPQAAVKKIDKAEKSDAEESRHLKEAVANREAI